MRRCAMSVQTDGNIGLTTVYVAAGMLHAMVIRGALESAGIPVMLSYEPLGPTYGLTVGSIGQVRVMVPNEWADEAQDLLAADLTTGGAVTETPDLKEEGSE
jgi:hypothetical protein